MPPGLQVVRHVLHPDGRVDLVLEVQGADLEQLAAAGGHVTETPGGVSVAWSWEPGMAPPDPVTACAGHVQTVLMDWARSWYGAPIDLTA